MDEHITRQEQQRLQEIRAERAERRAEQAKIEAMTAEQYDLYCIRKEAKRAAKEAKEAAQRKAGGHRTFPQVISDTNSQITKLREEVAELRGILAEVLDGFGPALALARSSAATTPEATAN